MKRKPKQGFLFADEPGKPVKSKVPLSPVAIARIIIVDSERYGGEGSLMVHCSRMTLAKAGLEQ